MSIGTRPKEVNGENCSIVRIIPIYDNFRRGKALRRHTPDVLFFSRDDAASWQIWTLAGERTNARLSRKIVRFPRFFCALVVTGALTGDTLQLGDTIDARVSTGT
jgi:hypothetical protein